MDVSKNIYVTHVFTVKDNTEIVLKIGNDKIVLDVDKWTEFFKNIDAVNAEFYRRFKYQYNNASTSMILTGFDPLK